MRLYCSEATQSKVFVRAPDSLNNCRKIYMYNDPTQRLPNKGLSRTNSQSRVLLFQFILAYN